MFANLIAAFIIIATGATLFTHGVHEISSAAEAASALAPFAGRYAEVLFGIGLFGASLLAESSVAIVVLLAAAVLVNGAPPPVETPAQNATPAASR